MVALMGHEEARRDAQDQQASVQQQRTVEGAFDKEMRLFAQAAVNFARQHPKGGICPSKLFSSDNARANFPVISKIALDVLAAPAGEAPSERAFSIASGIIGTECTRFLAGLVCELTRYKKNRLVFSI